jgi:hypothetical protein
MKFSPSWHVFSLRLAPSAWFSKRSMSTSISCPSGVQDGMTSFNVFWSSPSPEATNSSLTTCCPSIVATTLVNPFSISLPKNFGSSAATASTAASVSWTTSSTASLRCSSTYYWICSGSSSPCSSASSTRVSAVSSASKITIGSAVATASEVLASATKSATASLRASW